MTHNAPVHDPNSAAALLASLRGPAAETVTPAEAGRRAIRSQFDEPFQRMASLVESELLTRLPADSPPLIRFLKALQSLTAPLEKATSQIPDSSFALAETSTASVAEHHQSATTLENSMPGQVHFDPGLSAVQSPPPEEFEGYADGPMVFQQ